MLVVVALVASGAAGAHPPAPLPPAASAILKARFPGLRVLSQAVGPLHADDARDIAVVLGRGDRGARLVAVLWSDGAAGYRFANASGDIDASCAGCEVSARIRPRVLEVGTSDPGADVATLRTWRFAYRGTRHDVLRLVAVRTEQVVHDERGGTRDRSTSADLLTGEKVDAVDDDGAGAHPAPRERTSRIALRQPILFDQFAFSFGAGAPETRFVDPSR